MRLGVRLMGPGVSPMGPGIWPMRLGARSMKLGVRSISSGVRSNQRARPTLVRHGPGARPRARERPTSATRVPWASTPDSGPVSVASAWVPASELMPTPVPTVAVVVPTVAVV